MKSTLPDEELKRYRDSGSVIELQPGETLFEQGSDPMEMYALLRGSLAVIIDGVQIAEVSEGQVAGEMAFFLGERRSATMRALTVCELHAISPQKMRMLLQHPDVVFGLLQLFSRRVEAVNRALKLRTDTTLNAKLALEEEKDQRNEDITFLAGQIKTADERIAELETQLGAAHANLENADTLITQLQASLLKGVKVFSPPMERSALEIDDDLDLLAPPPAEYTPIARVALRQIAVPRPVPSPVFTEEGPTEEMPAVPPPLPSAPIKSRRDETVSYATTPKVPIGGRTQSMVAFDPDAYRREIVIDDHGARANETDSLIAEILRVTPKS
ncbi:MAG: Crp/Fnr family transcriptional regulator [Patescibacteria group bacterium]